MSTTDGYNDSDRRKDTATDRPRPAKAHETLDRIAVQVRGETTHSLLGGRARIADAFRCSGRRIAHFALSLRGPVREHHLDPWEDEEAYQLGEPCTPRRKLRHRPSWTDDEFETGI